MRTLLLAPFLLSPTLYAQAASFDCTKAAVPLERAICGNPEISDLDTRLGRVYREARETLTREEAEALKKNQKAWLLKRNYKCGPDFAAECLARCYEQRIAMLELLGLPEYFTYPAVKAAGEYSTGKAMSLQVDALAPRRIAVEIDGAELTMARWICEFSGIGEIDEENLARVKDPESGNRIFIAFAGTYEGGVATVDAASTDISLYCGRGGTLNGHYIKVRSPLWAPDAGTDGALDDQSSDLEENRDYQTPLPLVRIRAEQGDAAAQNDLAGRYAMGDGVPQDVNEALKWYRKAAEQGDLDAMHNLGFTFYYGKGVETDRAEGMRWLRKTSAMGRGNASLEIAEIYEEGKGVAVDSEKAMIWLRKAAYQGDARAQYRLGDRYYQGKGVPKNYAEAAHWLHKAAEQDDSQSQYYLAIMYMKGEGVPIDYSYSYMWLDIATKDPGTATDAEGLREKLPQLMTPSKIEKAKALADEWRADYRPWTLKSKE